MKNTIYIYAYVYRYICFTQTFLTSGCGTRDNRKKRSMSDGKVFFELQSPLQEGDNLDINSYINGKTGNYLVYFHNKQRVLKLHIGISCILYIFYLERFYILSVGMGKIQITLNNGKK